MYCKNCGYENDEDASVCENCGADLSSYYSEDDPGRVMMRRKILLVVMAIVILGVAISGIIMLENYTQTGKTPDPRASHLVCPYCGAGPNTMVAVRENTTHIKWYCQYCDNTWWEPVTKKSS